MDMELLVCNVYTLWQSNIAMENGPLINDFPIKPLIYQGFSIAMFDYQGVAA